MHTVQGIRCPNCGSIAKRFQIVNAKEMNVDCPQNRVTRTECPTCDYLMVSCSLDGRVLEAYSPGLSTLNYHDKSHPLKVLPRESTSSLKVSSL